MGGVGGGGPPAHTEKETMGMVAEDRADVAEARADVAEDRADVTIAEEIRTHHRAMVAELDGLSAALVRAAQTREEPGRAAAALHGWVERVLVPHAEEEEQTTYRAAARLAEGRLLIAGMRAEHVLIRQFAALSRQAEDPVAAATYARALFETFHSHQAKENDLILPLLVEEASVSLTAVLGGERGHHQGHEHHAGPEHHQGHEDPHGPQHHRGPEHG